MDPHGQGVTPVGSSASATPTPTMGPDAYEADNSYLASGPITFGSQQEHSLYPVGDQDWLSFTVTQWGLFTIETFGVSGDTVLELFDSSGVPGTPLATDNDSGPALFSSIQAYLGPGTYYIRVTENGGDQVLSSYQVSLTQQLQSPTATRTATATFSPTANCPYIVEGDVTANINGVTVVGSTTGATNDTGGSCAGNTAPDETWVFSLAAPATISVSTCGSSFDTVVYVRSVCNSGGTQLACNDDFCGLQSKVTMNNLPAGTYFIFVDGYSSSDYGAYKLFLTSP